MEELAQDLSARRARSYVRERNDEADGLARALAVLDDDIAGLEADLAAARTRDAAAEAERTVGEARAAIDAAEAAVRAFVADTFLPLAARLDATGPARAR